MSETYIGGGVAGPVRHESSNAVPLASADWLCLAATPVFAIMALLAMARGDGDSAMLCSAAQGSFPLGGMVPMYLLMSASHMAPWLRLISSLRRSRGCGRAS